MTDITHEALIERGFKHDEYREDGEVYTTYRRTLPGLAIEISGLTLIEIAIDGGEWATVPACRTLADLDHLIKLFV